VADFYSRSEVAIVAASREVAEEPLVEPQAVWSGCSTLAAMSGISLTL